MNSQHIHQFTHPSNSKITNKHTIFKGGFLPIEFRVLIYQTLKTSNSYFNFRL